MSMNILKRNTIALIIAAYMVGCGTKENDVEETKDNTAVVEDDSEEQNTSELELDGDFSEINWNHYAEHMNSEDQIDFQEYLSVLNDDEKFYCFDWCDKELAFNEYLASIESEKQPDIEGVTLVDLDDQNGKELVICIYEGGGNYLILSRDAGKIYGTNLGARQFENLQKDGKYIGAGGAGDLYFCRMKIDSNGVERITFGEVHGEKKEDGSYGDRLEVDGQVVNKSLQDWMEENYGNPAVWIQ